MMLGPVSAWLVWGVLALAGCGLWAVLWQAGQLGRYLAERWRDRREPLSEPPLSHPAWRGLLVRRETERLLDLPPERSREELGFTGENPAIGAADHFIRPPGYLAIERERRAPWWEAEHRAAYQSLGLDYPSGLLARIREQA